MPILHLSGDQKEKLEELVRVAPELIIHRARLILAYAAGKPTLQASREAGISRGRARYWKRQFTARGMEIFTAEASTSTHGEAGESEGQREETSQEPAVSNIRQEGIVVKEAIPFPQPRQNIGITPEDTLAQAGRKVWLFHFALMLCNEEGTRLGQDVEVLHDMRVATRRMRTAFDVFGQAFNPKVMKRYLKGLRSIGRALGEVRDMDVILEHALAYQQKMAEGKQPWLDPLLADWRQVIDKKRAKMTRRLQSDEYVAFKHDFNGFLQSPGQVQAGAGYSVMNACLRDIVPVLVYARYAAVKSYEAILPGASITQLHALRIEFKKFRYVLEYFREILGDNARLAINEIKQYQDHLGLLHDTDVACRLVSDFLVDWEKEQLSQPIHARQNPEPIVRYLAYLYAERYRLMSSFPELWQKFSRSEFRQGIAQAISQL